MPRPPQTRELAALRRERFESDAAIAAAIARVEQARRTRDRLIAGAATADAVQAARADFERAQLAYRQVRERREGVLAQIAGLSRAAANAHDDAACAALFDALEGDVPILLFPLRLETRYVRDALGRRELRVRIFPDAAQIQRHLQPLTEAEQEAGRAYWTARFDRLTVPQPPTTDEERMRDQRAQALWAEMVRTLRAPRAAYVVNRTRPVNAAHLDLPQPPPAEPEFAPLEPAGSRLAAQPTAVMLPDRFAVVGFAKGGRVVFRRFGEPVPDVLAMTPAIEPGDAPPPAQAAEPFVGEAAWLSKFDEALKIGMAVAVTQADVDAWRAAHARTPVFTLDEEIERLVVVGVDWTLEPRQAADGVAALFEAQAASAGMGFVPVGTPTNNTSEGASGHSPSLLRDPAAAQPWPPAPGTSAIEALRFALGLPDASFGTVSVPGAELDDAALAGHMANALYAGTIGGYLREMWSDADAPLRISEDTHDALRAHVVTYLRPAGPLQPLRIDTQPYGVLPVLAASRFVADGGFEAGLSRVLGVLRPKWQSAVASVPRFDGQVATTHAILQHGPWAQAAAYRRIERDPIASAAQSQLAALQQTVRSLPGGLYLQAIAALWGQPKASPSVLEALPLAAAVALTEPSRLPAATPWVLADPAVPQREADDAAPAPTYIGEIAAAIDAGADLKGRFARMRQASSLLHGLLAWSVDREADVGNVSLVAEVAGAIVSGSATKLLATPRLLGVDRRLDDDRVLELEHAGQLATLSIPAVTGDDTVGTYVARQAASAHGAGRARGEAIAYAPWYHEHLRTEREGWRVRLRRPARHLASVRTSLDDLARRNVGQLNWALRTTLDAFDYRLDAWYTSLATRRLARLRAGADGTRREGLHVGACGWVERLRPDPAGTRESRGHVLAPSLRHAAAAAVLRSGFDNGDANERRAFALDLASRRVRAARDLFEGLAQGQPLAVLLGYRFERGLRDAGLAQHILAFRRAFPLRPAGRTAAGDPQVPQDAVAARDVLDGVKLLAVDAQKVADVPQPALSAGERSRIVALHGSLAELWDAVADVSIAEAVYQVTQGNAERAAAALSVLDKQTQPVEPQSVLSPRESVGYTQRVALLFDTSAPPPDGWPQDAASDAEPVVNAWLAEVVGDPKRFVVRATVVSADGSAPRALAVHADGLGASPLALTMAVNAPGTSRATDDAQVGEGADAVQDLSRLRLMVVEALRAAAAVAWPGEALRIVIEEQRDGELGLVHLEALLALAQRLVVQSRPATRRDLAVVEPRFDRGNADGEYPGADADELEQRARRARDRLTDARHALDAAVRADDAAAVREALAACRHFGVLGAEAPLVAAPSAAARDAADLDRGRAALADLEQRLERIDGLFAASDGSVAARVPAAIDVLKTVFGKAFPVVPRFTMGDAAPVVTASLAAQVVLTAKRPAAVAGWLPKIAKVRDGVDRLQSLLLAREALVGALPSSRFAVLQSTARPGPVAPWEQAWAALPEAWPAGPEAALLGAAHRQPDLAVALVRPEGLQTVRADTPLAGIVCDDWAEAVPLHTSTAAIAFHFDAPVARPPQTLLLAVPPAPAMTNWSFDAVLDTVIEAIELSRLRAVRPNALPDAVNLALPMNAIPDAMRPDVAGFDIKALADGALRKQVAMSVAATLAAGKT